MSYQALYRVWRPQTFDEMVGQTAIKETLKNAVSQNQISHAYLFTGPRGTGKTSAAKILAKAVNCPHQTDGNPCNECELCRLITEGQLGDVIEIDAASNNGVDEIRNLRENVRYAASEATYKVYIIDEVHMLTTGAFNALLKTLEEPPANVIFILATTEPHKIPATIMSRVQRFDFQRITEADLIQRMAYILDFDQIPYDEEALAILARAANGGMRDSLSLLDQALSFDRAQVSLDSALQVSGSLNQIDLIEYIRGIYQGEGEVALEIAREQLRQGKQTSRFIEELILLSRDMLLTHHLGENRTLLSDSEIDLILREVEPAYYYQLIDRLNETQTKLRFTNQPDLYLEVMTLQLSQGVVATVEGGAGGSPSQSPSQSPSEDYVQLNSMVRRLEGEIEELKAKIKAQSEQLRSMGSGGSGVGAGATSAASASNQATADDEEEELIPRKRPVHLQAKYELQETAVYRVLNEATREYKQQLDNQWQLILEELDPDLRVKFHQSEPLASGNGRILIGMAHDIHCGDAQNSPAIRDQVVQGIHNVIGTTFKPVFIHLKDWQTVRTSYTMLRKANNNKPIDLEPEAEEDVVGTGAVEGTGARTQRQTNSDTAGFVQEAEPVVTLETPEVSDAQTADSTATPAEASAHPNGNSSTEPVSSDENLQEAPQSSPAPVEIRSWRDGDEVNEADVDNMASSDQNSEMSKLSPELQESINKTLELFGEENVEIHYDK